MIPAFYIVKVPGRGFVNIDKETSKHWMDSLILKYNGCHSFTYNEAVEVSKKFDGAKIVQISEDGEV